MADHGRASEADAGPAPELPRPSPSPVSALFAGLQAAQTSRTDFFVQRPRGKDGTPGGDESSSSSRSPEGERLLPSKKLPSAKLVDAKSMTASEVIDTLAPSGFGGFGRLSPEGILLDMHLLMRDASVTLDVFKGSLLVIMVASNVIITMSSIHLRSHSFGSLLICNTAASQCFVGFLMSFGFSCYGQYLKEWPDPVKELGNLRLRVTRAIVFPVLGAWLCNFAWCFLCLKNDFTKEYLIDVFTFAKVFGSGPDFLCSFSFDLAVVYALWRPIMHLLEKAREVKYNTGLGYISRLSPEHRRDLLALTITLSPLLFTLAAVPECTFNKRWIQWFLVCDKRDVDTPSLPALPHLTDFGIGILAAACWNRLLADLRPVGNGGPSGGSSLLPLQAVRKWGLAMLGTSLLLLVLFLPLGQVWLYTDLSVVQMPTPFGQLVRGFSNGPSMLWLLATLWPVATWAGIIVVLVTLRGTPLGCLLHLPLSCLEHLGANVLYYLVVTDLFLAGMFRGLTHADPNPLNLTACLGCTTLMFVAARFLHFICKASRK